MRIGRRRSYGTVTSTAAASLYSIEHSASPVLQQVWDVADRVAVGQEVPAPCAVSVVVEPGAEDQVSCRAEENSVGLMRDQYCNLANHLPEITR